MVFSFSKEVNPHLLAEELEVALGFQVQVKMADGERCVLRKNGEEFSSDEQQIIADIIAFHDPSGVSVSEMDEEERCCRCDEAKARLVALGADAIASSPPPALKDVVADIVRALELDYDGI